MKKKTIKYLLIGALIIGAVLFLRNVLVKDILVLENGTIIISDNTTASGGDIFYRNDRKTGYVEEEEKICLIKGAKVFVYPSIYEGFGLPVLEALSMGVPTITGNKSSLPEVAGNAALLIDTTSVDELYAATNQVGFVGRMESDGMPVLQRRLSA